MARACLLASPGLVAFVVALSPTPILAASSGPACGHANVSNPGHHYGLIKNGCMPSRPVTPSPSSAPASNPPPAGVGNTARQIISGAPLSSTPAHAIRASEPSPAIAIKSVGAVDPANAPSGDRNLWVVMALLPTMLALWVLLVVGASASALHRLRQAAPVAS